MTGNPGNRPIAGTDGSADPLANGYEPERRETKLIPHAELTKGQQALWDRFIETAWWLTEHDEPTAYAWVKLQHEHDLDPLNFNAARIGQMRTLASELGFTPASRASITAGKENPADAKKDPVGALFDGTG
ncbi:MAG: hypothetical protein AAF529_14605 [Pseudomonadota bacterium]